MALCENILANQVAPHFLYITCRLFVVLCKWCAGVICWLNAQWQLLRI